MKIKIKPETIARTVILTLALINQIFAILGREQIAIANDDIYQLVSIIFTVLSALNAWWSNNSFSKNAILADIVLDDLNAGRAYFKHESEDDEDVEAGTME